MLANAGGRLHQDVRALVADGLAPPRKGRGGGLDGQAGVGGICLRYRIDDFASSRIADFHGRAATGVDALAIDDHLGHRAGLPARSTDDTVSV